MYLEEFIDFWRIPFVKERIVTFECSQKNKEKERRLLESSVLLYWFIGSSSRKGRLGIEKTYSHSDWIWVKTKTLT